MHFVPYLINYHYFQAFVSGEKKQCVSVPWFGVQPFSQNPLFFLQALGMPSGPSLLALGSKRGSPPSPSTLPSPPPLLSGQGQLKLRNQGGVVPARPSLGMVGGTGSQRLGSLPSQVCVTQGWQPCPVWGGGSGVAWDVHSLTHTLSHRCIGH